jgi:hypothetical protein
MPQSKPSDNPFDMRWLIAGILTSLAAWAAVQLAQDLYVKYAIVRSTDFGYTPNPDGVRRFLGELERPTFRDAGAEAIAGAKGKDSFPYRSAIKAHHAVYGKPFGPWNQGSAGTCVSFGWGMGSYIGQCVDWTCGRLANPPPLVSTEPIYGGSRTAGRLPPVDFAGWSDGSYGGAAARWVAGLKNGTGGILYRQKYGSFDLSEYSIEKSREWGAYGVPAELAREANKHTARSVALIETYEGLCAALESGYCVPVCSNVGFAKTNVRDKDGFLPRGGTWNHCMLACAVRHAQNEGGRDGILLINSWGDRWVTGPKWPADQPDGSFWISKADAISIISQGDSFAIGGVDGFSYRQLDNGNWLGPVDGITRRTPQPARLIAGTYSLAP